MAHRTRLQVGVTMSPEAFEVLKAMAERLGTSRSQLVERLVMEAEERHLRDVYDRVVAEAVRRPKAKADGLARALKLDESEVQRVLDEAGLETEEERLTRAARSGL